MLLAAAFLLALALVSREAARPLPLAEETVPVRAAAAAETWLTDINTATAEELCALPGVGPVIAERIVALRPFGNPEDLLAVEGIGEATLEKIYEYLEGN
ncbi:MAG: helix-hairpin-helix domain-containing protein [Ruminococcaceae bacterium]|nr:helix-hairpin-helix domain-containing protein [Oscillospiraceae bacterium]